MARSRTPRLPCSRVRLALHAIEDAAGLGQNLRPLFRRVTLAEQLLEHRARVAFLRQRLRGRAPGQARANLRRRQLERRQPRVLPDVLHGQLVGGHAGARVADAVVPRLHAAQPGGLDVAVRLGRLARLVAQARHDGHVLPQRLERRQDRRHVVVGAGLRRGPLVHDGAVREADEGEPRRRLAGRRLRPCLAAGFIASRSGSAIAAPTPLNTIRREMCFRDRYIAALPQASGFQAPDDLTSSS